ncbi:regulatory protein, luxR family [Formosa sp. Hel1_31_208]|uniref:triple tyrosine motif-containing protein n=1 Tax=Formosa sp. Hel1_31_208 TaxID=1798225 RepID=UPI00087C5BD7|nr:triple tyrosine motif-containing protein [Formosa sp. Hel1_31_208]SDS23476.1 regulatory protein, luxR family [Formosa sp. Hel1_31_208]
MRLLTVSLFLVFCIGMRAQEIPPVEIYSTKQYHAENQNWAISQSSDQNIFVANNKGLLEFNGESWRLYSSPQESIMRAVLAVDDVVYTGNYMEFGYWKRDKFGKLNYTSLSQTLNLPLVEDEEIWNILKLDDWILFQSLDRIIIYNTSDGGYKIINSKTKLTKAFKADDSIFFQSINLGLFKIENGKAQLFIDDDIVKENTVVNMFIHEGEFLIQTQNQGFFTYKNNSLEAWNISTQSILNQVSVYNSIQLSDKSFALGTISNGIIYLHPNGDMNYQINQSNGLSNNTVLSLFEDDDYNIWLALDNGINCVNTNSPFSIYNDQKGTIGTVYTSIVHNGLLYLGTNQGLFYKSLKSKDDFKFIKETRGQVWSLAELYDTLFCSHNNGTFIVEEDTVKTVNNSDGTWNVKPIATNQNLLLEGSYNGLNILELKNGEWKFKNKIEGFDISSRYFEYYPSNQVFVSHEYKGVFKLKVDEQFTKILSVDKDTSVDKGLHSSLLKHNGNILYTYKDGVYKYNKDLSAFKKDSLLSLSFNPNTYISGKLVKSDETNKLWSFSSDGLSYISSGKLSEQLEIEKISLPSSIRNNMGGYENISHMMDQKYLFGSSSGYLLIDLDKLSHKVYTINVNAVSTYVNNNESAEVVISEKGNFKNKENDIEFSYSVTEYDKYIEAEYQYQLEGAYNQWSDWTTKPSERFKNLPSGEYTFRVKAKVGDNLSVNEATYEFTIAKPWHLTNAMLTIYFLSFIVLLLLTHNIYKRYYKKQREGFLKTAQREIEMKKLENEQQLMSFKNEKLRQDIEGKNRELAISTMSLIKKNEFLNTIKNQLKSVEKDQDVKSVIAVIDRNINNTDDWKFFQEAFNNADKDFLKKVKSKHPDLTPNDLKLCAYLRLNLTSKEIAPLLNISPRSVEVKRYRLRKKMDLPHEFSLTNYILDI